MITGFYVGFENASWQAACITLANTIQDKVKFCKSMGREIKPKMWPCNGLPHKVLGDGAELKSYNSDKLSSMYGIEIMNAASYRADWKGTVEKKIDIFQKDFKAYTEAYVPKSHIPRVDKDYRLKANIDIHQFNIIILELVLAYNNFHRINGYDLSEDMLACGVNPVPIEIWNWGMVNRTGLLKHADYDSFVTEMLPQGTGYLGKRGIRFKNINYKCSELDNNEWFRKLFCEGSKVICSYDVRDMTCIYLKNRKNGRLVKAEITEYSNAYRGLSLREIQHLIYSQKKQESEYRIKELTSDINTDKVIQNIINEAANMAPDYRGVTKSSRLKNIADNKKRELSENRKEQNIHNLTDNSKTELTIEFSVNKRKNYKVPSRTAKLRKKKAHKDE